MILIAITGGIGSGKSVVSEVLRLKGYKVLDSDIHARRIMDADAGIKARIAGEICCEAIVDGNIDRRRLAAAVFSDAGLLGRLNAIVHPAVVNSLAAETPGKDDLLFVETAIFYQSRLNRVADAEWRVESPMPMRVARVMRRSGLTAAEVAARIKSQVYALPVEEPRPPVSEIVNDECVSLLGQINALLEELKQGLTH